MQTPCVKKTTIRKSEIFVSKQFWKSEISKLRNTANLKFQNCAIPQIWNCSRAQFWKSWFYIKNLTKTELHTAAISKLRHTANLKFQNCGIPKIWNFGFAKSQLFIHILVLKPARIAYDYEDVWINVWFNLFIRLYDKSSNTFYKMYNKTFTLKRVNIKSIPWFILNCLHWC